ncbi:hypothetical protein K0M31_013889, partial [Melipona bicolor]
MISNNPVVLFIDDLKFQQQWQQLTREFSRHRLSGFFTQTTLFVGKRKLLDLQVATRRYWPGLLLSIQLEVQRFAK